MQDLNLQTVARHLQLEPVEYLTTRKIGATPRERAAAIQATFADPEIAAIMASIGGSDLRAETHLLAPEVCAGAHSAVRNVRGDALLGVR